MGIFENVMEASSRKPEGLTGVLERRKTKRVPTLRASRTGLSAHLWELEMVPAFALPRLAGEIEALSRRSLDQNLFFGTDVVCAAWPRLNSLLAPKGCWMMCLWETIGERRHLRMFMPMRIAAKGWPHHKVLEPLSNEFMPVGTPLLDADCAGEATETFLRLLGDPALKLPPILDLTHQLRKSKTFDALAQAARSLGLETAETARHERAALIGSEDHAGYPESCVGRKSLRDYKRLMRRLEEQGVVKFSCARTEDDVLDAFEAFMTVELKGWKGRRGTALYNHKQIAAFSRQIVAEMAGRGRCQIFSLTVDGRTIGALIMLGRNGHMVPWKIAFDEKMSAYSPGVQIMLHATKELLSRKDFVQADSIAVENHWMINHLWPDRLEICDLGIEIDPQGGTLLRRFVSAKEREIAVRQKVRGVLSRFLRF